MTRRFRADVSRDDGNTWKKLKSAQGWAIDIDDDPIRPGYVVAIDDGQTMIDVVITERDLRLMTKDVAAHRNERRVLKGVNGDAPVAKE